MTSPVSGAEMGVYESVSYVDDSSSWSGVCGQCGCEVEGETMETVQIGANSLHAVRSKVMKNTAATLLTIVLSLVAACAPAAPTPTRTPEPTATPVEVLATKPADLAGIWFDGAWYQRFEADGTIKTGESIEDLDNPNYRLGGVFWFEDGTYYEQNAFCLGIYVYDIYLAIEEGRAVRLRMTLIEEGDPPCVNGRLSTQMKLARVD